MEQPATHSPAADPTPFGKDGRPLSHTQENPLTAPHTKINKSTIAAPEPFIRIFLLAWAVRYIPRGFFGEIFSNNTLSAIKKPVNRFADWAVVNRMEQKINQVLSRETALVHQLKADKSLLRDSAAGSAFYNELKPIIRNWRGDASKEIKHIVEHATLKDGKMALANASKSDLRTLVRGKLDDIGYSLSLFVGSSLLSLRYSRLVRGDIQNVFCEAVAYEKDVPESKVTFKDITRSDNRIVQGTVRNYRHKMWERLGSDSLFLLTTPFKSMHVTDFLLGVKGVQMFRDTWRRNPTIFEDIVTFVNNKINPTNGLGQPVSIGEVFDLYQHYAQAYQPDHAFVGVIEHAKSEGIRWGDNQLIFHRMTELLNLTYAYKHDSIVDSASGLTVLQADFALPKFLYLLGHDLIDVTQPERTLVTIELANKHGIPAVKDMQHMLQQGATLAQVMERYPVTLPVAKPASLDPAPKKSLTQHIPQFDVAEPATPAPTIEAASIAQHTALAAAPHAPAL